LYQELLRDASLFDLLLRFDEDVAEEARLRGCECGGALHAAFYERKPRGGPPGLDAAQAIRFSFCCAREGCRRRLTPASLRFLGRRVFFGAVVLLVPILMQGPTRMRLRQLRTTFAVSVRTLQRWRRWWRETFPTSRFWGEARGRLARPVSSEALPGALLGLFWAETPDQRVLAALRFLAPITTGTGRVC